jgi:glycogen debranching enzyme
MDVIQSAYDCAREVLKKCETPHGFFAAFPGYDAVWARDSMIMSIGARLLGKEFEKVFRHSLLTLAKHQSKKGQIPNAVDTFSKRKAHVDYKSIDSSLWFVLGHYYYKRKFGDALFIKQENNIKRALRWLSYQDMGEDHMLEQLPTTDWQDAFPHRYGHTINTQALYYKALILSGHKKEAFQLKKMVNDSEDDRLWNGTFYLPWRWKNHNAYSEKGEWFDSLGNLLAIIFNLATPRQAESIFKYIHKKHIHRPYPMKSMYPPIKRGTRDWQDYFLDSDSKTPYHYSNGGIWSYIGGVYVCALVKYKKFNEAEKELLKLAEANLQKPYFSEWLHGKTGKPGNFGSEEQGNQGWNAAMYIAAYLSVKEKKCLIE